MLRLSILVRLVFCDALVADQLVLLRGCIAPGVNANFGEQSLMPLLGAENHVPLILDEVYHGLLRIQVSLLILTLHRQCAQQV